MYITQFGDYVFPDAPLENTETAGASKRSATTALGGAGGAWDDLGAGPDPLAEDSVNKSYFLQGSGATAALKRADLQDQVDSLVGKMMFSSGDYRQGARLLVATMADGEKRCTWAKCMECRARWDYWNENEGWLPVSLIFKRTWPVWEQFYAAAAVSPSVVYLGDHLGTLQDTEDDGITFGQFRSTSANTIGASPDTGATQTNEGNARFYGGVAEFNAGAGTLTGPIRLTNSANGYWVEYAGSLIAGDRLTIYPALCIARLNGANCWGDITFGSERGQITPMVMEPGANVFVLTHGGVTGSPTFRYFWTDAWL